MNTTPIDPSSTTVSTKRESRRSAVSFDVSLKHHTEQGDSFEKAQLVDLGTGGVFVRCEQLPTTGSRVALELNLPTAWEPLQLTAEVRWTAEGQIPGTQRGFGAEFVELKGQHYSAVQEIVWINQAIS